MIAFRVFYLILAILLLESSALVGRCDIDNMGWHQPVGRAKTCFLRKTGVGSTEFLMSSDRDETVKGFYAQGNEYLEFLPKSIGETFPNLLAMKAQSCSLKIITKGNFKDLTKLQLLALSENRLEAIDDDTFDYIPAVEKIWLFGNKIKKINSRVFASLSKLVLLDLSRNECIDEDFSGAARIAEVPRLVDEKCGCGLTKNENLHTCVVETHLTKISKLEAELKTQGEVVTSLKSEISKLEAGKAQADSQVTLVKELQAEVVTSLKSEISKLEAGKAQADSQLTMMKDLHDEGKAQLKEICAARMELKVQENANLSNDLQIKMAEISEKNEQIKQCEKKIQT